MIAKIEWKCKIVEVGRTANVLKNRLGKSQGNEVVIQLPDVSQTISFNVTEEVAKEFAKKLFGECVMTIEVAS